MTTHMRALATGYPARHATGLYRGMIAPLLGYPFHGAIWYQGESNALKAIQYRTLLPALIESWRTASHQPEIRIRFTNAGSGLVVKAGAALRGFAIAGADRKFHWASAMPLILSFRHIDACLLRLALCGSPSKGYRQMLQVLVAGPVVF